ncbi:MAG: hypothetical protein ABIM21_01810, partial [candidate division WOR-3 bacterium]
GRVVGDPPLERGPLAGITVPEKLLVEKFLQLMDWDAQTCIPSEERLTFLGLEQIIKDFYKK